MISLTKLAWSRSQRKSAGADPLDIGTRDWRPVVLTLRAPGGTLVGGVYGATMWQWLMIYERLGYVVFAELPDFPDGHSHYHLKKLFR
jgi:hypothetical protein